MKTKNEVTWENLQNVMRLADIIKKGVEEIEKTPQPEVLREYRKVNDERGIALESAKMLLAEGHWGKAWDVLQKGLELGPVEARAVSYGLRIQEILKDVDTLKSKVEDVWGTISVDVEDNC